MITILYPDSAGAIQSITLLDLEVKHASKATPADHPVETGATITDHVRAELESVTLRGFVTNSLVEPMPDLMGGAVASTTQAGDGAKSFSVAGLSRRVDRVQLVFDALRALQASRQPCTIVTGRRRYETMILTDIQFPESNRDGAEITIEAREIRIVTTRTAQVTRPRQTRGHRNGNAGNQTTQVPDASTTPPIQPRRRDTSSLASTSDTIVRR